MTQSRESPTLAKALEATRHLDEGEVQVPDSPDAHSDPELFGVAVATTDGELARAGDTEVEFTIQSIAKALVYALAIEECGWDRVIEMVDVEPSGEAFNSISIEEKSNRPDNPMINAGAMTIHALVGGADADADERFGRILQMLSDAAGRPLRIDETTYERELAGAYHNMAIAHMLRGMDILPDDPEDVVRGYLRQCAVLVTAQDLALMGATLANGGVHPLTGTRVFGDDVVRHTVGVMTTCGMYSSAGDWTSSVGIPAKSGIGGAILGTLPGCLGIASFSPLLDRHGNSTRGQELFGHLARELDLHLLDPTHWRPSARWRTLD